ncbi:MAG TPA: DHHA1 domain-containing protein [Trueperaceae bacterium]
MTTERAYRKESYRTRFESEVLKVEPVAGDQGWVLLEKTLFYPTAGGQPHDTGMLGDGRVVEVENRGDEVWHLVAGRLPEPGKHAVGLIDWERRYRHMQRHSGQHLLSQAFVRAGPAFATVSVSLSGPVCTLDLAGDPNEDDLRRAEHLAAEAVYANHEICTFEVDESEVGRYPLRREPKVAGRVRLVQMGDWDTAACGGTHLKSTAEVGPVKLLRSQRVRGNQTRVQFCCGWEALEDYQRKHQVTTELALDFSAQVAELPARVAALQDELAAAKRALDGARARLAEQLAGTLLREATPGAGGRLVVWEGSEGALLRPLARALAAHQDVLALLGASEGDKARLLFARGAGAEGDMAALLRAVLPAIEGKGGGKPDMAQGSGGRAAGLSEALEVARHMVLQE